jgi:hypothetical protein
VQLFALLPAVALDPGELWMTSVLPEVVTFTMTAVAAAAATSSLCLCIGSGSDCSNVVVGRGGGS